MMNTRKSRIARGIQAILNPSELPITDPDSFSEIERATTFENIHSTFTTSDGVEYYVDFDRSDWDFDTGREKWEVSFDTAAKQKGQSTNKFEVMEYVASIVMEFIKQRDPEVLDYVPTTKSRSKLYPTMIKRMLPHAQIRNAIDSIEVVLKPETAGIQAGRETGFGRTLSEVDPQKYNRHTKATIYRAVPETSGMFNLNDYVTMSYKFARDHAAHNADMNEEPSAVLRVRVSPDDVVEASNPGEFFYTGESVEGKVIHIAKPSY